MLLHKTRRKELNLDETVFKCYKKNIQELNKYVTKLVENPHEPLVMYCTCNNNNDILYSVNIL
jgi:hypothetical protein